MDWKQSLLEAVKELLRVGVLAIIPVVITGLEGGVIDWKAVAIVGCVAVLKAIDKFVHKWEETPAKGILPF